MKTSQNNANNTTEEREGKEGEGVGFYCDRTKEMERRGEGN